MSGPEPMNIRSGFEHQARTRPDSTALIWDGSTTSYGELALLVTDAERRLAQLGAPPRQPVALLVEKSPAAVAHVLACLRTGRPFLLPAPKQGPATLQVLIEQAGCWATFRGDGHGETTVEAVPRPAALTPPAVDDVSFMLTTSGSTGLPKIVPIPDRAVARFIRWAAATFDIGPKSAVFNFAPLNFDLCLLDVWTTLAHGGRVVLVTEDESVRPERMVELLNAHRVQVVQAVPMCFGLLGDVTTIAPSVTHVAFTGDAIPQRTLARLPAQFPNARLFNIYGCTETNDSFVHELGPTETAPVSLGAPIAGVEAVVVDDEGETLAGAGQGELYVATPFQTGGYLDGARNVDKFVADPTGGSSRTFFRTGDLVHRDTGGRMTLVGRSDHQVKVRGVAVNTAEVERVLLEHPNVSQAVVVVADDPLIGHRLEGVVSLAATTRLNSLELRKHCAQHLPRAAIPSTISILDRSLPITSTGKPDRQAVAACLEKAARPTPPTTKEMHHVP